MAKNPAIVAVFPETAKNTRVLFEEHKTVYGWPVGKRYHIQRKVRGKWTYDMRVDALINFTTSEYAIQRTHTPNVW